MYLLKNDDEFISISRINLHYQNGQLFSLKHDLFREKGDHYLVKANKTSFKMKIGFSQSSQNKEESQFYAVEGFNREHLIRVNTNLLTWYFSIFKTFENQ